MKPTHGTSIPFPASLACQLETKKVRNYYCVLVDICTKKNNFQTRPAFAELLSFPKSTMGELQPVAKDSVQGIPIAAIISVPISGRQCFWLHLGQKQFAFYGPKNSNYFVLMFGCKIISRTKVPKTWKLSSSKRLLEVVNVGNEPSFVLTRPRFTSGCGFWERSLNKLIDGWKHLTVWRLGLYLIYWLSISPIGGNRSFENQNQTIYIISCHGTKTMRSRKWHSYSDLKSPAELGKWGEKLPFTPDSFSLAAHRFFEKLFSSAIRHFHPKTHNKKNKNKLNQVVVPLLPQSWNTYHQLKASEVDAGQRVWGLLAVVVHAMCT